MYGTAFSRNWYGREDISIVHVPSPLQHTDFLTKAISQGSLEFHRILAMNVCAEGIVFASPRVFGLVFIDDFWCAEGIPFLLTLSFGLLRD